MNIAIWYRISPWFQTWYYKFNPTLHHWATAFFKWSLKIRNLCFCSKIFKYCHLVQNFPPVTDMLSKIQFDPFHWATAFFILKGFGGFSKKCSQILKSSFSIYSYSVLTSILDSFPTVPNPYRASLNSVRLNGIRKYTIWVYIAKSLNIAIWFRIFLRFQRCYQNSIRPFTIGLQLIVI